MRLPKYITVTPIRVSQIKPFVKFTVSVKWWGWPIIAHQCIKERVNVKWYEWPMAWLYLYPKCCIRLMWGGAHGN